MLSLLMLLAVYFFQARGTIIENGRIRPSVYNDTKISIEIVQSDLWRSYPANASEVSYKGRWDKQFISWWSAPGVKFGFTGGQVAIIFGEHTIPGVLIAYRFDTLDWQFSNVTKNSAHQFLGPKVQLHGPQGLKVETSANLRRTFELRVTNYAYGVQIQSIHVASNGTLFPIPARSRSVEIIGDSLTAGQYASYEGLSSWAWIVGNGLGAELSVSAYPGNCLTDIECWGNKHGQSYQWFRTSDTSWRATQLYGQHPEMWDFTSKPAADLVIIHLGTNDQGNNVTTPDFVTTYIDFVGKIHTIWPKSDIVIMTLCNGFLLDQNNIWRQTCTFENELKKVYEAYKEQSWIHLFNTTGILAHNDIGPRWHYTDVGNIKLASHLIQYVRLKLNWEAEPVGAEVLHDTTYWNDEAGY